MYAFCRVADDIVDGGGHDGPSAVAALERHRRALLGALRGEARCALFRELAWAVRRFGIPASPFHDLITMLRTDVAPVETQSWDDLSQYCGGVASTVGEMCAHVFGVVGAPADRACALAHARTLGVAMQLTNVLRDVGEDAARGRCYLPAAELASFGLQRSDVLEGRVAASDARWIAMMRFQVARARDLYSSAAPGLDLLERDAQCCARICASGYAAILGAIERRGYDTLSGRAHIGGVRKSLIALRAWQSTLTGGLLAMPLRQGRVSDRGAAV